MLEINKIHLGDSYKLIKDMPDNSIDCIYTDIPYLHQKGGKGSSDIAYRIDNLNKELNEYGLNDGIDYQILDEFVRVMKKINIFIWCSKEQFKYIFNYFTELDTNWEIIFWGKTNPIPVSNNTWHKDKELCLYFRAKGVRVNDGYEFKKTWFTSAINKDDKEKYQHPNIKPLELVKSHLLHATQDGDLVADFFSGSGTTAVACKDIGRQFIGIEIDEEFHKISTERLNGINARGETSIFTDFDNIGEE